MPDGPAFRIEQISMQKPFMANGAGQMPPSQLVDKEDYRDETKKGIMVGYCGHVPRARDKVGGSPLGNLPGTPVSPNGKVGIDMEAIMSGQFKRTLPEGREKTFAQHEPNLHYVSEARDQGARGGVKPQLYEKGLIPGYGGHKREAKFSYGSSVYVNGIPKGGAAHDNWSDKNFASTGHGASSQANWADDVGLNTEGDVAVTSGGTIWGLLSDDRPSS